MVVAEGGLGSLVGVVVAETAPEFLAGDAVSYFASLTRVDHLSWDSSLSLRLPRIDSQTAH